MKRKFILFTAINILLYAGITAGLLILLKYVNFKLEWGSLALLSQLLIFSVPLVSLGAGVAGGMMFKRFWTAPAVNAAALAIAALVLLWTEIFSQAQTAIVVVIIVVCAFGVSLLAEWITRSIKYKKPLFRAFGIRNRSVPFFIGTLLAYGLLTLIFYGLALNTETGVNELEVYTFFIFIVLPILSLIIGLCSGLFLDRAWPAAVVNALGATAFLLAVQTDQPAQLAGTAAVCFTIALLLHFAGAKIRDRADRRKSPR